MSPRDHVHVVIDSNKQPLTVFCKVDGIYLYCFCYVHVFNNETWQKSNINKYIFRRRVKN